VEGGDEPQEEKESCLEILQAESTIRYDGVMQKKDELYNIEGRNKYIKSEYFNLFLSVAIYPFIPIAFMSAIESNGDVGKEYCNEGSVVPYYIMLAFEAPF
jgi:hypothetical protein